jgi:hypothetical protein
MVDPYFLIQAMLALPFLIAALFLESFFLTLFGLSLHGFNSLAIATKGYWGVVAGEIREFIAFVMLHLPGFAAAYVYGSALGSPGGPAREAWTNVFVMIALFLGVNLPLMFLLTRGLLNRYPDRFGQAFAAAIRKKYGDAKG